MRKVLLKMELKPDRLTAAVPSSETARMELRAETRTEAAPIGTAAVRQARSAQVSNAQASNKRVRRSNTFLFFPIYDHQVHNNIYYSAEDVINWMMKRKCSWVLAICLAIIFLSIIGSWADAQTTNETDSFTPGNSCSKSPLNNSAVTGDGNADVILQKWRGLATGDNESYPVRLNVQIIKTLEPAEARMLLESNFSIDLVKSQTKSIEREAILRGNMKLDSDRFMLSDIKLVPSGNISFLEANLSVSRAGSGTEGPASVVGRIAITIMNIGNLKTAKGEMFIDDSKYSGSYSLLFKECYGPGPRGRGFMWGSSNQ